MGSVMLVAMYLAAAVAANLSAAAFGPSATVVNAFLFIGLDLTARDALHDCWRGRALWPRMAALVLAGSAISYAVGALLSSGAAQRVAMASGVAFLLSGSADALTYHLLRRSRWAVRVNGSNVVSAAVDSLAFPSLAFGGWLWGVALGQLAAKAVGGLAWSALLARWRERSSSGAAEVAA